jgi:uncharacterized membrane protein YdfJ with MMPL/SSD domain
VTVTLPRWIPWLLGAVVAVAASVCAVTLLVAPRRRGRPQESAPAPTGGATAQRSIDEAAHVADDRAADVDVVYEATTDSDARDTAAEVGWRWVR